MDLENVGSFQHLMYKIYIRKNRSGPETKFRALNFWPRAQMALEIFDLFQPLTIWHTDTRTNSSTQKVSINKCQSLELNSTKAFLITLPNLLTRLMITFSATGLVISHPRLKITRNNQLVIILLSAYRYHDDVNHIFCRGRDLK